ncbi:MAG: hypothetical protein ABIJ12_08055 [bacterium]
MKKIAVILIILITLPGIILSQTKVGTTRGEFLLISPSIRSNGMGQIGTALVDEYSFCYNPGSLGLFHLNDEISITPYNYTKDIGYGIKLKQPSLAIPVYLFHINDDAKIGINCAFSYSKFDFPEQQEITYQQNPEEIILDVKDELYDFSIGIGYSGSIQFAVGGSYRHLKETINTVSSTGSGFDVGLIVRKPLGDKIRLFEKDKYRTIFLPSLGFSYSFLGMGVRDYEVQWARRIGFAITSGIEKKNNFGYWQLISITPSIESEKLEETRSFVKYGTEIGLLDAFYFRFGKYDQDNSFVTTTWGFTLSSNGIFKLILSIKSTEPNKISKTMNFLANKLTFQYSMAHYNHDSLYDSDPFRGFTIKYKLSRLN